MKLHEKFQSIRTSMTKKMIEREAEIDLTLCAMVAGENLLLVGPPGTAKSLMIDSLVAVIGGKSFNYLMTKFTTPQEIFGPIDLAALKENKYRHVTKNKLPEADLCYLDEISCKA